MRLLLFFILLVSSWVCVESRGGIRIRFSGRIGGYRSGGRSSGGRSSGGRSTISRPRGKGGWFSSSGSRTVSGSKSTYSSGSSGSSFSRLSQSIERNRKNTNYGTKYPYQRHQEPISKKKLGLGVGAGFIGGSGYGYASSLATYSVYHRYLYLMFLLNNNGYRSGWDDDYYSRYYERNKCLDSCGPNSHCEWGICECDYGYLKSWGRCTASTNTEPAPFNKAPFQKCFKTEDCSIIDINLICSGQGNQKFCKCRKDLAWNSELLECQVFLDVNCKDINENTSPSMLVKKAANVANQEESDRERKEKERLCEEYKQKPHKECKKAMERCVDMNCQKEANDEVEAYLKEFDEQTNKEDTAKQKADSSLELDTFTNRISCRRNMSMTVIDKVSKFPDNCDRWPQPYSFGKSLKKESNGCSENDMDETLVQKASDWKRATKLCMNKDCERNVKHEMKFNYQIGKYSTNNRGYQRACGGNVKSTNPVDETLRRSMLLSDFTRSQREGNSGKKEDNALDKRTETKNESLASSLLIHIKDTKPQEKDLVEAFCRDVDSFNLAFQDSEVSQVWRPSEYCAKVPDSSCAVVYDSHDCYSGWSMNITNGAQLSLSWSNRNDIDTIGVKAGCTFIGFSDNSFDGTKISIYAGATEKWIVLANEVASHGGPMGRSSVTNKQKYKDMDENIESLQCICRGL